MCTMCVYVYVYVCACARACVRVCVRVCACATARACVWVGCRSVVIMYKHNSFQEYTYLDMLAVVNV